MEKNGDNSENIQNEGDSRVYELGFHIVPIVGDEGVEAEFSKIKASIEKVGGKIFDESFPEKRTLTYKMDASINQERFKFKESYFGWIKFEAGPEEVVVLKEALDLNEHIFRSLIVNTVRENTIYGPRILPKKSQEDDGEKEKISEAKEPEVKEEEIDKSIEELVVE